MTYGMHILNESNNGVSMFPEDVPNVAITIARDCAFVIPSLVPEIHNIVNTRRNEVGYAAIVQGF